MRVPHPCRWVAILAFGLHGIPIPARGQSLNSERPHVVEASPFWKQPATKAEFLGGSSAAILRIDMSTRLRSGSYWKEGALIGTAVAGIVSYVALTHPCPGDRPVSPGRCKVNALIAAPFLGAFFGGIPGALIGKLFHKRPQETHASPTGR